jgi:soluble lytic murein transglycosylase-like protein
LPQQGRGSVSRSRTALVANHSLPGPIIWAFLLALAFPAAARAQIYAWRDASGNLVLSDQAKDPSARSYAVATQTTFRTTTPLSRRAAEYQSLIEEHSTRHAVSADLVRAVIQAESAFNPRAVSPKGAMGLMQLMPATAAEYGVRDPYNPAENIRAGVAYLKQLLERFKGQVELALAAYNAGPTAVQKYGGTVPPYRETRAYVAKIQKNTARSGRPAPGDLVRVYRSVEIVDGREVVRYTGTPRAGSERVTTAERR